MKLEDLKVGDKVWWWFDAGIKPDLMFGTVRKIGKKKVLLESENGDLAWRYPDYIDGRQLQTTITDKNRIDCQTAKLRYGRGV